MLTSKTVPFEARCYTEAPFQWQAIAARTDFDTILAAFNHPSRDALLPVRGRVLVKLQVNLLSLSGLKISDLCKTLEHKGWVTKVGSGGHGHIELNDLGSRKISRVRDRYRCCHIQVTVRDCWLRQFEPRIFERGIRETVPTCTEVRYQLDK